MTDNVWPTAADVPIGPALAEDGIDELLRGFFTRGRTKLEVPAPTTLLIDPGGVYFRPEGAGFICGVSPSPDADPDCLDFEIDYTPFEEAIWPCRPATARR